MVDEISGKRIYRAYEITIATCRVCGGSGHIRKDSGVYRCECNERYQEYLLYANAGIPEPYWLKNMADYVAPDTDTLRLSGEYLRRLPEMYTKGVGLYFWGPFGVGKSGLMAEILKGVLRSRKYSASFQFFPDVMQTLTNFDSVAPERRAQMESLLEHTDFLVIDDVGREYRREGSNWVGANMDAYLRKRMNANLPTLMTSNFSLAKVKEFYGDSILSVFTGSLVEVAVVGRDFREIEGAKRRSLLED